MDGVAAVKQVLHADATLTATVPASRIVAGPLPQGITLPAVSIASISRVDRNLPNPGTYRFVRERVQVTVQCKTDAERRAVLHLVRGAAADKFPSVSGIIKVTIHTDGAGPDFNNENANIYLGEQDFIVTYSEAR